MLGPYIILSFRYYFLRQYFCLCIISCTLLWGASSDGRLPFPTSRHLANKYCCCAGLERSACQGHPGERRFQPADSAQDDAGVDQVLQADVRRIRHPAVARSRALFSGVLDPGQHQRAPARRQRTYVLYRVTDDAFVDVTRAATLCCNQLTALLCV